jgi:hypothetical protein
MGVDSLVILWSKAFRPNANSNVETIRNKDTPSNYDSTEKTLISGK